MMVIVATRKSKVSSGAHKFEPGNEANPAVPNEAVSVAVRPHGAIGPADWITTHNGHPDYVFTTNARFLTLHTPAGFEQFAAEVGEPAQALTLPPQSAGPPDFAALVQAAARHQITILAPPPQL